MYTNDFFKLVLDNSKEMTMAADPTTGKIHYVNAAAKEFFGNPTESELQSTPCYKLFRGESERCSYCPAFSTHGDYTSVKDFYEHSSEKYYSIQTRSFEMHGTPMCIGTVSDVTIHKRMEIAEMEKDEGQSLLLECIETLTPSQYPEETLHTILKQITEFYQGERGYVVLYTKDTKEVCDIFEWCQHLAQSHYNRLERVPFAVVESWAKEFEGSQGIVLHPTQSQELRQTDTFVYFKEQHVNSLVVSHLFHPNGSIMGFIGVDNPMRYGRSGYYLYTIAKFTERFLKKYPAIHHSKELDTLDTLTKSKNRYSYGATVEHHMEQSSKNLGIVCVDLDRLKYINDICGHETGNQYIVTLAETMQSYFGKEHTYRISGDEFIAICQPISEMRFLAKLREFRLDLKVKTDIPVSLGYAWSEEPQDIRCELVNASEMMRKEKKSHKLHDASEK